MCDSNQKFCIVEASWALPILNKSIDKSGSLRQKIQQTIYQTTYSEYTDAQTLAEWVNKH